MVSRVEIIVFIIRGSFFEVYGENRPVTRDTFYKSIDEPGFIGNIKVGFQPKARLKSVLPNKLIQKIKSL